MGYIFWIEIEKMESLVKVGKWVELRKVENRER
jgi:hypothetical protein